MAATIYGAHVEFRDILSRRRMHRAFLPDPRPEDQIERIANVIRRAPSGGFSQAARA
jgi:nitroreductase